MRIWLVTPAPAGGHHGNRVTAERWATILRGLGHHVQVATDYHDQAADLLIALHARRGAAALRRFHARHPHRPVVLALTGTDLYPALAPTDIPVLELADRLVVLQPLAAEQVPAHLRDRVRVVFQSAPALTPARTAPGAVHPDRFEVVQLAHLRPVKDPLLVAAAARRLPDTSRIHISHAGTALDPTLGEQAARENRDNPRYRWHGDLPRHQALQLLAGAHLLVLSSRHEGGANAITEALAADIPVLATRIPGTVGILGPGYPGYFPTGDEANLARLLRRAETESAWYRALRRHCAARRHLVSPARERDSWKRLLAGVA